MTQMGKGVNSGEVRAVCDRSGPPAPPRCSGHDAPELLFLKAGGGDVELEAGRQEKAI